MVKADAYNHGMALCNHIEELVDAFGVSTAEEGVFLRKAGIIKDIKVVAIEEKDIPLAASFDLTAVIPDIKCLKAAAKQGAFLECDLKLDSGMNRLGINTEERLREAIKIIDKNANICVSGLFTHFSFTDYRNLLKQAQRFDALSAIYIREKGSVNKSCAASAGLCCGQRFLYDEVRAGLALYGYMPSRINFGLPLRKAMSVTVPIMAIKNVAKGEKIGYGGLYVADKDVKIGIIRGGYFDGISRAAAGMRVYVNGQETQLIGSVCMDLSFVLLDGIKADVGDNVILLGEENDARAYARRCRTIPYEVLTSFKGRINRIYYL
jgi:alanine racemase